MSNIDLTNSDKQLEILSQFLVELVNVTDKNKLYWHVAKQVVSRLGFIDCVVYELDRNTNTLSQVAAHGNKNPTEDTILNPLVIPLGKGITGSVAVSGEPILVKDISREKRYICDIESNQSEICVPIIYNQQVMGVIDCEDPVKNKFTDHHLRALMMVSSMLAAKLLQYEINCELQQSNVALNQEIEKSRLAEQALLEHQNLLESKVKRRTRKLQLSIIEQTEETRQKLKAEANLRKNQTLLFQSSKMASIGVLAAGVAHEINNPMAFIQSNLQTLKDYLDDYTGLFELQRALVDSTLSQKEDAEEIASQIKQYQKQIQLDDINEEIDDILSSTLEGTSRVSKIVSELKDFAYQGNDEYVSYDINRIIDNALSIAMNNMKYKVKVITNYSSLPPIKCQIDKLGQVFLNLLVNAAQAIEEQGEITIGTYSNEKNVLVKISDSGVGMSEEVREKIFDPFFTTKEVGVGTGLGLHISYNIIDNHGGTIEVKSKVNEGTSITVSLPIGTASE